MTIKYLVREDGVICEWHSGIKDFTGLKPYEFPIETQQKKVKKDKEKLNGDPNDGGSE